MVALTHASPSRMRTITAALEQRSVARVHVIDTFVYYIRLHEAVRLIDEIGMNLTGLKVLHISPHTLPVEALRNLFRSDMPNVKEIKLSVPYEADWDDYLNVVTRCRNIEVLELIITLTCVYSPNNTDNIAMLLTAYLSKLRSLHFRPCHLSDVGVGYLAGCIPIPDGVADNQEPTNHPQLEELTLSHWVFTDKALQNINKGFNQLRSLTLVSTGITDEGAGECLANMRSLRELSILNCKNITGECVRLLCQGNTQITKLEMSGCGELGDCSLRYLGQSDIPLKELSIIDRNITDEGLKHLTRKNLIKLTLIDVIITNVTLKLIANNFPVLRYLAIAGEGNKLTERGKECFREFRKRLNVEILSDHYTELTCMERTLSAYSLHTCDLFVMYISDIFSAYL